MKMMDLISENPFLLIMLDHFGLDMAFREKDISIICKENGIGIETFLLIANLYNGFFPSDLTRLTKKDAMTIISFLHNSHQFYLNEKIPEIQNLFEEITEQEKHREICIAKQFFSEYKEDIKIHLDYEDNIAFPYFYTLIKQESQKGQRKFSVKEYREHHTDIESKVTDLKKLFINYIFLKKERVLKRKLLFSLINLESDLNIHTIIEEVILSPLIRSIEKKDE